MTQSFGTSNFVTMVGLAVLAPFVCGIVEGYARIRFTQIQSKTKLVLPDFHNIFWILWSTYFFIRLSYFCVESPQNISLLVGLVYGFVVIIGVFSIANCLNDRITWTDQTINIRQRKFSKSYHFSNVTYIRRLTLGTVEIGFDDGHSMTLRESSYGVQHLWRDVCKWLDDYHSVSETERSSLH